MKNYPIFTTLVISDKDITIVNQIILRFHQPEENMVNHLFEYQKCHLSSFILLVTWGIRQTIPIVSAGISYTDNMSYWMEVIILYLTEYR